MKKITVFAILILAVSAMAAGEYTGTVNDKPISIVFVPGPFSPGESGGAVINYDGNKAQYDYIMTDKNGMSFYRIIGLCDFIGDDYSIEAYQPLNVKLTKTGEFVKQ